MLWETGMRNSFIFILSLTEWNKEAKEESRDWAEGGTMRLVYIMFDPVNSKISSYLKLFPVLHKII